MLTEVPTLSITDAGGEPLGAAEKYHELIHAICQILDESDLEILKATKECATEAKEKVAKTTQSLSILSGVLRTSLVSLLQSASEEEVCNSFSETIKTLKKDLQSASGSANANQPCLLHSQLLAYEQLKGSFRVATPHSHSTLYTPHDIPSQMPQWQVPSQQPDESKASNFLSASTGGMKGGSGVFASVSSVRSRPREAVLNDANSHDETDETVALWLNENFSQMAEKTRRVKKGETPENEVAVKHLDLRKRPELDLDSSSISSEPITESFPIQPPQQEGAGDVDDAPANSEDGKSRDGKNLYSRKGLPMREGIMGRSKVQQLLQELRVPFLDVDSPDFDIFKEIELLAARSQNKKSKSIRRTASTSEQLTPRGGSYNVLPDQISSRVEWAPHNIFVFVCVNVIFRYTFPATFEINARKLIKFLLTIQSLYRESNPYHNSIHAADVLQTTHIYLTTNDVHSNFSDLEIFSLLFSALVHDVGHVGVNNQFLSKIEHPLATLYNHKSPLENLHTSLAFYVLHLPECNFLERSSVWGSDQMEDFRNLTTDIISGTDMKFHRAIIHSVNEILEDGVIEDEEIGMLMKAIVHAADLSNPMKPLHLYLNWMRRINEEFWLQGDEEKKRNLPVSVMCDRTTTKLPESQAGFISFIVKPFVSAFSILLPEVWMERLDENLAYMNVLIRKNAMKLPNHVAQDLQSEGDASESEAGVIRPSLTRKASVKWQSPDGTSVEVDVETGRLVDDDHPLPTVERRQSKKASDTKPQVSVLGDIIDALFENTEMGGGSSHRDAFLQGLNLAHPVEPWVDTFSTVTAKVPVEGSPSPGASLSENPDLLLIPQHRSIRGSRGVGVLQTALAAMIHFKLEGSRVSQEFSLEGARMVSSIREKTLVPVTKSADELIKEATFKYLQELASCVAVNSRVLMEEGFAARALLTWVPGLSSTALETLLAAVEDASLHNFICTVASSSSVGCCGGDALSTLRSLKYSHEGVSVALQALLVERELLDAISHPIYLLLPPSPSARPQLSNGGSLSPFREPYTLSRKYRASLTAGAAIGEVKSPAAARGKLRPLRLERTLAESDDAKPAPISNSM